MPGPRWLHPGTSTALHLLSQPTSASTNCRGEVSQVKRSRDDIVCVCVSEIGEQPPEMRSVGRGTFSGAAENCACGVRAPLRLSAPTTPPHRPTTLQPASPARWTPPPPPLSSQHTTRTLLRVRYGCYRPGIGLRYR